MDEDERIDFDAAEIYLRAAREAYETGNELRCLAARKMVAVALLLKESPPIFHTGHIQKSA